MNQWIEKSIEIADSFGYLDNLQKIYPQNLNPQREISLTDWVRVVQAFDEKKDLELVKNLLLLEKFPFNDSYISFLRKSKDSVDKNPLTVKRIASVLYELGLEKIEEKCKEAKESSRQRGQNFQNWLHTICPISSLNESDFLKEKGKPCFLKSNSDKFLKDFAIKHLGFESLKDEKGVDLNKGLDFIARKGDTFFVGESKFVSDDGGSQDNQFDKIIQLLNSKTATNVVKVGVLDGVSWIPSKKKNHKFLLSTEENIFSALLLKEFLENY